MIKTGLETTNLAIFESVLRLSESVPVRFGPFRSVPARSGPFRPVPVNRDTQFGGGKKKIVNFMLKYSI